MSAWMGVRADRRLKEQMRGADWGKKRRSGGVDGVESEGKEREREGGEEVGSGWSLMSPRCRCVVGLYNIITPMSPH